jgi:hypothetical protein
LVIGDDSVEDASGEVIGVATLEGEPSDALLPEVMLSTLEFEDDRLRG